MSTHDGTPGRYAMRGAIMSSVQWVRRSSSDLATLFAMYMLCPSASIDDSQLSF